VDYTAADGTNTWDDGAGTFSFASDVDSHYYFVWNDAMKFFSNADNYGADTPTCIEDYYISNNAFLPGWHLPTKYEWNSIAPSRDNTVMQYDIFKIATTDGTGAIFNPDLYLCFGYNDETKGSNGNYMTESSYWYRVNATQVYAIRYCGTPFCSAWKYEIVNSNTLRISCTLLNTILTAEEAETTYGTTESNWTAITFGNDVNSGAVQRSFYASGWVVADVTGYANSSTNYGEWGHYWATSLGNLDDRRIYFHFYNTGLLSVVNGGYTHATPIRLFKDAPTQHEAVDLGLSVKWATTNVGAATETDYGGYYCWAGTTDVTDTSIDLGWNSNCPYWDSGTTEATHKFTKYVPTNKPRYWAGSGSIDNKTTLDMSDDVAHVKWGGAWRMPTIEEWEELIDTDNCTWTWYDDYNSSGIPGYLVTSKIAGYTSNSIFLPAGGYRKGTSFTDQGVRGDYRSSSVSEGSPSNAKYIVLNSSSVGRYISYRCYGRSVRPVLDF
jgi:hypothetical protein